MRWIYISPHLDDAVLSCGGLIWELTQSGLPVEVWTIACGYPPPGPISDLARECHDEWGTGTAEQTVSLRREEDHTAVRKVGATAHHFDILDCIYRRSDKSDSLYAVVFVPPHPADTGLPDEVAVLLSKNLNPDDIIVCPLAIGLHVDHAIVRSAVERLNRPLLYYADIPYLLNHTEGLECALDGLFATVYPISYEGLHAWQDGIAAYASQISMLFLSQERMRAAICGYWQEYSGIRLWRGV